MRSPCTQQWSSKSGKRLVAHLRCSRGNRSRWIRGCAFVELEDGRPDGWLAFQDALHAFGAASNDRQIGLRGLIGCGAALLPVAECSEGNTKPLGEFFLSQTQCAANDFCLG